MTHAFLQNAIQQVSSFLSIISCIKNVDIKDIAIEANVTSTWVPNLTAMKWRPGSFEIKFKDSSTRLPAMPSPGKLAAILREHEAPYSSPESLCELACKLAEYGFVYIEAISPESLNAFLKIWSDAYGEDHPDTFVHQRINSPTLYGFIRTKLTPEEIAARDNEDGDDDYKPDPLFNKED